MSNSFALLQKIGSETSLEVSILRCLYCPCRRIISELRLFGLQEIEKRLVKNQDHPQDHQLMQQKCQEGRTSTPQFAPEETKALADDGFTVGSNEFLLLFEFVFTKLHHRGMMFFFGDYQVVSRKKQKQPVNHSKDLNTRKPLESEEIQPFNPQPKTEDHEMMPEDWIPPKKNTRKRLVFTLSAAALATLGIVVLKAFRR